MNFNEFPEAVSHSRGHFYYQKEFGIVDINQLCCGLCSLIINCLNFDACRSELTKQVKT